MEQNVVIRFFLVDGAERTRPRIKAKESEAGDGMKFKHFCYKDHMESQDGSIDYFLDFCFWKKNDLYF